MMIVNGWSGAVGAALVLASVLSAAAAHAGGPSGHTISVTNATGEKRTVKLYNNNDDVQAAAASEKTLNNNQTDSLACNTQGSCKMYVEQPGGGRDYGTVSSTCVKLNSLGGLQNC